MVNEVVTINKLYSMCNRNTCVIIRGKKVLNWTALKARESGIETVFQDRALCPQQSIVWNIFMGKELRYPFGFVREKEQVKEANRLIREIGFTSKLIDAESPVGNLSGGERQGVAIARAIYFGAKVLILDEPTSALGQKQQMEVLKTIKKVQQLGNIAIILITHNEIHARLIADRYTFISLGEVIGSGTSKDLEGDDIRRLMAGGAEVGDLAKELA